MNDWDAARYHRLSQPQFEWGRRVLARLAPRAGERILDLGCGTGRLTAEIARGVGRGRVVGLDRSETMLDVASKEGRAANLAFVRGDGAALPFQPAFDAIFSAATLHWVADHAAAFASVHAALAPGGRFVAQCGGGPNLRRLLDRAHGLMASPEYAPYFQGWRDPWVFAGAEDTRARLIHAGFVDVTTSLTPAPTLLGTAPAFADFLACVCVRHHIARLPVDRRPAFVAALTAMAADDDPPFTLDYWRLDIDARKDAA